MSYTLTAVEEEEIMEIIAEAVAEINEPFAKRGAFKKEEPRKIFDILPADEPYKNISTVVFRLSVSDDLSDYPAGVWSPKGSEAFCAAMKRAIEVVTHLNSMNYLVMREAKRMGGSKSQSQG